MTERPKYPKQRPVTVDRILLRPEEAAEAMAVSRGKVFELIARGELPSVLVGGSRRVPVDAIRAWVAKRIA
jgi:excisionase family DNA binding protein